MAMSVWAIVLWLSIPVAVGYGLSAAFKGDALLAVFCAYWSIWGGSLLFSFRSFSHRLNNEEESKEERGVRRWEELTLHGFYVGFGHGLEAKLKDMLREGVDMPPVLFDLCAQLQSRMASEAESAHERKT